MKLSELDSFLPSAVQMAPSALQSVVTGRTMVTSPLPCGFTVMSQVPNECLLWNRVSASQRYHLAVNVQCKKGLFSVAVL